MNKTMKTCPGYGEDGPHELSATRENFRIGQSGSGKGRIKSPYCIPHESAYDAARDRDGTPRKDQMQGVYLAAIKLSDGDFLVKIGESAQIRTRAGIIAANARHNHGLDIEWAEIMYVIEVDDEDGEKSERLELEGIVLAESTPIYGTDIYPGIDFDLFTTVVWMGEPYTERTTSYDRRHQFFQWLAKMDGLEMSPKQED